MITITGLMPAYQDYLEHERQLAGPSIVAYLGDLRGLVRFLDDKPVPEIEVNDLWAYMRDVITSRV